MPYRCHNRWAHPRPAVPAPMTTTVGCRRPPGLASTGSAIAAGTATAAAVAPGGLEQPTAGEAGAHLGGRLVEIGAGAAREVRGQPRETQRVTSGPRPHPTHIGNVPTRARSDSRRKRARTPPAFG